MFNFLTAFLCLLGPLFSRASTETGEIKLLKSLYDSTSGPSWIYPSGTLSANKWNFANDNDPCASNFAGLTCYSMGATDYISSIALPGFNLQGFMDVDYEGFKNLTTLVLTDNKLTGFSDGVGKSTTLRTLALNKNSISGLLPTLASMSSLDTLLLNNNVMSGSLSGRLPDAPRLTVIDVSNNKFSGAKWSQLLGYPSASFISAGFNCFDSATVNLAEACSISSLEMLYLSSVGSGCRERIWAWQARNLNRVENTVPACLLTLPNLKTLTLADNGFSGTLTAEEPGAKLKSLDLSRNDLTGNIPMQLQKSVPSMESLDLSHNRLDGEISRLCDASSAFGTCTENNAVKLSYNHLSGKLSENINFCGVVDVLGGNLFSCALSGSDALPNKDPNFVEYRCGSEDYDASLYFYAVSFFLFFLTIVYVLVANYHVYTNKPSADDDSVLTKVGTFITLLQTYQSALDSKNLDKRNERMTDLTQLVAWLQYSRYCCLLLAAVAVVVILPVTVGMKQANNSFRTYDEQYAWLSTLPYLSNGSASAVVGLLWLLCVLIILYFTYLPTRSTAKGGTAVDRWNISSIFTRTFTNIGTANKKKRLARNQQRNRRSANTDWAAYIQSGGLITLLVIGNIIVVMGVNIGFVAANLSSNVGYGLRVFLQLLLTVFKLGWDMGVVPLGMRFYCQRFPESGLTKDQSQRITLNVWILSFDAIVAPCVASLFSDPQCFHALINNDESTGAVYSQQYCDVYNPLYGQCTSYATHSDATSIPPGFLYRYSCGSAVLTTFMPVQLYTYTFLAFLPPLYYWYLCAQKQTELPHWLMWYAMEGCLWPKETHLEDYALLTVDRLIALQYLNIVTLLTFGLASAPLLTVCALAVVMTTLMWELIIGRYLIEHDRSIDTAADSGEAERGTMSLETVQNPSGGLELSCANHTAGPLYGAWIVIWTSSIFYALILYDVTGNGNGKSAAVGQLFVVLLFPIVLYAIRFFYLEIKLLLDYLFAKMTGTDKRDSVFDGTSSLRDSTAVKPATPTINKLHAASGHQAMPSVTPTSKAKVDSGRKAIQKNLQAQQRLQKAAALGQSAAADSGEIVQGGIKSESIYEL